MCFSMTTGTKQKCSTQNISNTTCSTSFTRQRSTVPPWRGRPFAGRNGSVCWAWRWSCRAAPGTCAGWWAHRWTDCGSLPPHPWGWQRTPSAWTRTAPTGNPWLVGAAGERGGKPRGRLVRIRGWLGQRNPTRPWLKLAAPITVEGGGGFRSAAPVSHKTSITWEMLWSFKTLRWDPVAHTPPSPAWKDSDDVLEKMEMMFSLRSEK